MIQKIFKNILAVALNSVSIAILGFILVPILLSKIGLDKYSLIVLVLFLSVRQGMFAILDFGLPPSISKFTAQYLSYRRNEAINILLSVVFFFYTVVAFLIIGCFFIFKDFIFKDVLQVSSLYFDEFLSVFSFYIFTYAIQFYNMAFFAYFEGLQKFHISKGIEFFSYFVYFLITITLLNLNYGYIEVIYAMISMHILTFVLNLLFFKYYSNFQFLFQFKSDVVIELIKYSKLIYIGNIAGNLNAYYPKFFITTFLGSTYLGIYDIVSKIPNVVKNMLGIANAVLVPVASELSARAKEKDNSKLFLQGLKLNILFYIPFITVFIFYSEAILKLWLGIEYIKYSFLMQILMLVPLLSLFISHGGSVLAGINQKLKEFAYLAWVIMVISLIFMLLTTTEYQLYGVSISRWIGLIIVLPYVNSIFIKIFDLDTKRYLIMIIIIIIEFLLLYIINFYILKKIIIHNVFELIIVSIITYFIYFFVIYFSIYGKNDKEFLKNIKSTLLKKVK